MNKISREEYANAVVKLLPVSQRSSGQSRVCAQVLLSAYNGYNFQLAIPDLWDLDDNLYEAAIVVIRGRAETGIEPYELVSEGSAMFVALHNSWPQLHIDNRSKAICPVCNGRGVVYRNYEYDVGTSCTYCEQTGKVCQCKR